MIIPFPTARRERRGTIHVMTGGAEGFEIGHESASGDSWGSFETFGTAQEAIAAAHALNRETYEGVCDVFVCDEARPRVEPPLFDGDF